MLRNRPKKIENKTGQDSSYSHLQMKTWNLQGEILVRKVLVITLV